MELKTCILLTQNQLFKRTAHISFYKAGARWVQITTISSVYQFFIRFTQVGAAFHLLCKKTILSKHSYKSGCSFKLL